jgi:hypothetical protein
LPPNATRYPVVVSNGTRHAVAIVTGIYRLEMNR